MSNSVRHRATGAALAALVLGGGAVGCTKGAQEESPALTPAAAVAKAAKKTGDITSFRYRMSGKVPMEGRISAEAAMSVKPLAMSMKMTGGKQASTGPFEIRLVGKAMYVDGGTRTAKDMDGKRWMKFDMSVLGAKGQPNTGQAGDWQADKNPATESAFLDGSKDLKKVGAETVDGVKTTHYKGTVPFDEYRKSLKSQDKTTREKREKALDQYEKMGIDKVTMDMWIDGDDRAKQLRMRGAAHYGPLDLTITFLDYNKPVTVTAPPAKDTVDLAEMMKGVQQQG
ncbi:DUF1396 domain-containing protein [Streptomyces sp. AHU1]|uniref:DUF1396 domain-containing protein n=1 Tax=Streptomyces sp. AHU1 TaxID=3377215 RepID=UPI003877CA44